MEIFYQVLGQFALLGWLILNKGDPKVLALFVAGIALFAMLSLIAGRLG